MKKKKLLIISAITVLSLGLIGGVTAVLAENTNLFHENDEQESIDTTNLAYTSDQAKQVVSDMFPSATMGDVQIDLEDEQVVYTVQITLNGLSYEVKVNADNGTVLSMDLYQVNEDTENE
ncbi:MAG: PepSY domain-containing protein [Candidatus Izemoplasmatales bacterium]